MGDSHIKFELTGIGAVLQSHLLEVPMFQRSYAWKSSNITDYQNDLWEAYGSDPQEYFLGTVVLTKESDEGRYIVIDGQQRLATTTVLLAAIRDHLRSIDQDKRAQSIEDRFIGPYDDETDTTVPRLIMNSEDNEFFKKRIAENDRDYAPTKPSHDLLAAAQTELSGFVDRIAASVTATNQPTEFVKWRKFIEENVKVISVTVPNESDAFSIFETLNDRGANLTLADLLKNYLFGKGGSSNLEAIKQHWTNARNELDNDSDLFILFVRHLWSSKKGATRERDLYKKIKEQITSPAQALAFAKELEESAERYAALLNPESDYWSSYDMTTKRAVAALDLLGLEQNRPTLLAVLQYFTAAQVKRTIRAAVSWSVRGLIVGGIGGGTAERAYCDAAMAIRSGNIKTAAKLLDALSAVVPADDIFEDEFKRARVNKNSLARYYLNTLELAKQNQAEPELVPNSNADQVNLEHVLPTGATSEWPDFSNEERRAWALRISNMALLKKSENTKIGNKSFAHKKPILAASSLELTKMIGEEDDWNKTAINDRGSELAALAVQAWQRLP